MAIQLNQITDTFTPTTGQLSISGAFSRGAPVTITGATYTVGTTDDWIICNQSGALTITLPTASSWNGRELMFKNISAFTTSSASSNVVPLTGGAATADILGGSSGATTWCTMVSDGTNWIIMQGY